MQKPGTRKSLSVDHQKGCSAGKNPFRINCIHGLEYTDVELDLDALLLRLKAMGNRGALVGPHGHGKSTLMRELGVRVAAMGCPVLTIQLTEEAPAISPEMWEKLDAVSSDTWLFLDGAEQLGYWAWRQFSRKTQRLQGLIITQHTPGRLPVLHTCRTTPELLDTLLARLCTVVSKQVQETAHLLYKEKNGDLRAVFLELYDRVAEGSLRI